MIIVLSCTKNGKISPYYKGVVITATYKNIDSPSLKIDSITLSKILDGIIPKAIDSSNRSVYITLTNVRFKDDLGTYEVIDPNIKVEEYTADQGYQVDVEDSLTVIKTQSLNYVLVLDFSASLGDHIAEVRADARNTVQFLKEATDNVAKVAVIAFGTNIVQFPLTDDYAKAMRFIDTCNVDRTYTSLFEAMDHGINLLDSTVADGLAMIAFTDGINNNWSNPKYEKTDVITQRLGSMTYSRNLISCYTIGYTANGGVDKIALNKVALNGGFSAYADDYTKLNKIFSKVANSVSNVYTLTYKRNNSKIGSKKIRFTIKTALL
jgi:hypothetical protein